MINVSAIIISDLRLNKELTNETIKSLKNSESDINFEVIVVEGDTEADINYEYNTLTQQNTPFNYNNSLNIGIEKSSHDIILLLNNDLVFEENWLTEIISAMDKNPEILSTSPLSPESNRLLGGVKTIEPVFGYEIAKHLAGYCIVIKKEVIERIGKIDERVDFWYSDNIYAEQLKKVKIKHALIPKSKIIHLRSKSLNKLDKNKYNFFTKGQINKFTKI